MGYFSFTFRMNWKNKDILIAHMNKYWQPTEYCLTKEYSSYDYKVKSVMLATGEHIHLYFHSTKRLNTMIKTWLDHYKHASPPPLVWIAKEYNKGRGGNQFKKFTQHKETDKDKKMYILGYILKQKLNIYDTSFMTNNISYEFMDTCIKYRTTYDAKRRKKLGIALYDKCIDYYETLTGPTGHNTKDDHVFQITKYEKLYQFIMKYRYDNKQGADTHQTNRIIYAILFEKDGDFRKKNIKCCRKEFFRKHT